MQQKLISKYGDDIFNQLVFWNKHIHTEAAMYKLEHYNTIFGIRTTADTLLKRATNIMTQFLAHIAESLSQNTQN
jgi:hypothetical protein